MTVRKYGEAFEWNSRGQFHEAAIYVSDSASDTFGGGGAGTIFKGNGGNDVIFGRGGDDILLGGSGKDTLVGGTQADSFVFNTSLSSRNVDRIADFSRFQRDKIVLDNNVFAGLELAPTNPDHVNPDLDYVTNHIGGLEAEAFRLGTTAVDADDRILYDQPTGSLYFDRDGSGLTAAVKFAQLKAGLYLTYLDFLVY
jgi:Ca2+-binding RTX toxin-like protein